MDRLEIRINHEDKQQIKQRASVLNVSVSDYIRQMSLHGFAVQYRTSILYDLQVAINRIGTNINQIAKVCNETRSVLSSSLLKLQEEHAELRGLLSRVLVLDEDRSKLIEILSSKNL